jgi:prepilin peptidase CpaA
VTEPGTDLLLALAAAQQACFFAVLIVAAVTDITARKVHNWLTLPAIAAGLAINFALGGFDAAGAAGPSLVSSLMGFALGFAIFFVAYALGGVGGGDVKLIGAVGAILGYPFIVSAIFWSALVGAFLALAALIWRGRLVRGLAVTARAVLTLRTAAAREGESAEDARIRIPYGAAIAFGSAWAWVLFTLVKP